MTDEKSYCDQKTPQQRIKILNHPSLPHQRYVWGRRQARPLKEKQRQALASVWLQVSLELPEKSKICLADVFAPPLESVCLEIGFGGGEHLATQAAQNPTVGFIGCEPFINGVASLVLQIQEQALTNIRIVKDDARLLLARLPDRSIDQIFVLFPDPWPKNRHHKRRIIQDASVNEFARLLKQGGLLKMATDDAPYATWIQNIMTNHDEFEMILEERASVYERPPAWPSTRYEQKGIVQGRAPVYLTYRLKS